MITDMRIKPKRKAKKLPPAGYEGSKIVKTSVRVTATRSETRSIRAKPGTFEWRYARAKPAGKDTNAALYLAGSEYARTWERAGVADMGSPNKMGGIGGGARIGLADRRCEAMDKLEQVRECLGIFGTARLTAYCVEGQTTKEIANKFGADEREMGHVLHSDLRSLAKHLKLL
ncbi:hypothetical protein [Ochrobactrum sp. MYb379]|uniref:hypothetical protein n=1 Tax=Ochrobactrum sp. MYb379 TaxID=2745275 RepID=UPI0030A820ED